MRNAIKWSSTREAYDFVENIFYAAARIVSEGVYTYNRETYKYDYTVEPRRWFTQTHIRHQLHPAVHEMMYAYWPGNWHQLLLEWPHKSLTDPNRIAYNRDERSAMHNNDCDAKAVITTIGKYLTRHFPGVPDNEIRDIVAKYTYGGSITITHNTDAMVEAVMKGPASCMTKRFDLLCEDGMCRHPYAVYDSSLGWGMAVRREGDAVLGRCLVWTNPDDEEERGYVRSYKRERDESSHSGTDEAINAHLQGLGFAKWSAWPTGAPLKEYKLRRDGWLMPYIDGGTQKVDAGSFTIDDDGDIAADSTAGTAGGYACTCEDCGEGFHEDEGDWVGIHEDRHVCGNCIENYTYAYSRRGSQYYIEDNQTIYVNGDNYDTDYLSDNNIVELHDGGYEHTDNVVFIKSEDAYYREDDDDVCYAEDSGQCELCENCWRCEESGNMYTDDEAYVEVDGCKYHPDHAPEQDEEDEEDDADEAATTVDTDTTTTI